MPLTRRSMFLGARGCLLCRAPPPRAVQDARIEGHPPYELIPVGPVPSTGNFDATDKLELSSIVDQKLRHGVGIYVGQSNGAAFLGVQEPPYRTVRPENRMLDIHSGRVFRTSDPVLGCDGSYQFIGSRIADHLIASNVFDVFTNVPIAIGGTDIGEWAYGGCSHRVVCCAARLRDKGYKASFVNLIIGENNQSTSAEVFATAGRDLVRLFRSHGIESRSSSPGLVHERCHQRYGASRPAHDDRPFCRDIFWR
jgi:hypothetical protein